MADLVPYYRAHSFSLMPWPPWYGGSCAPAPLHMVSIRTNHPDADQNRARTTAAPRGLQRQCSVVVITQDLMLSICSETEVELHSCLSPSSSLHCRPGILGHPMALGPRATTATMAIVLPMHTLGAFLAYMPNLGLKCDANRV